MVGNLYHFHTVFIENHCTEIKIKHKILFLLLLIIMFISNIDILCFSLSKYLHTLYIL